MAARCEDPTDKKLLSRDLDGIYPFLDPQKPITEAWLRAVARQLELPEDDIRQRYRALAQQFGLTLAWED
jgi:hypothetical protein